VALKHTPMQVSRLWVSKDHTASHGAAASALIMRESYTATVPDAGALCQLGNNDGVRWFSHRRQTRRRRTERHRE
jgi:hypothetical protein